MAQQYLNSARSERSADSIKDRYRIAAAYRLTGEIDLRMGDGQAAMRAWTAGLAQLPATVTERPREMHERVMLLRRVGKDSEAEPLTIRLTTIGYRRAY